MSDNGNTLKYRVEQLEDCNGKLEDDVKKILTNHLPHIQQEILITKAELKSDIADLKVTVGQQGVKIGAIAAIASSIVSALIGKFF